MTTTTTQLSTKLDFRGSVEVHTEYDPDGKRIASYVTINLPTGMTTVGRYESKFQADGIAEQIRSSIETQIYGIANLVRAIVL